MKQTTPSGWLALLLWLVTGFTDLIAAGPGSVPPPVLNDPVAGEALASSLRSTRPATNAEIAGLLKIRRRSAPEQSVPVISRILLGDHSWRTIYQATLSNRTEILEVLHFPGKPNDYFLIQNAGTEVAPSHPVLLHHDQIWQPFAGSDFSLADLGQEFFHWPRQMLVTNEMRKSRACHVLESLPAVTNDYARVRIWVDVESNGLLMAEAYDAKNRRVKEFEVKSINKVGEQYQPGELEIRDLKNRSRTVMEFPPAN
jgi:hypothetical protein